jgi:hypothetical protein
LCCTTDHPRAYLFIIAVTDEVRQHFFSPEVPLLAYKANAKFSSSDMVPGKENKPIVAVGSLFSLSKFLIFVPAVMCCNIRCQEINTVRFVIGPFLLFFTTLNSSHQHASIACVGLLVCVAVL